MSVWVGGSVAVVKQPQCCQQKISLTLLPASPRPIFRPFCCDIQTSCGTFCQRERVMLQMSCGAERVEYVGHTAQLLKALLLLMMIILGVNQELSFWDNPRAIFSNKDNYMHYISLIPISISHHHAVIMTSKFSFKDKIIGIYRAADVDSNPYLPRCCIWYVNLVYHIKGLKLITVAFCNWSK